MYCNREATAVPQGMVRAIDWLPVSSYPCRILIEITNPMKKITNIVVSIYSPKYLSAKWEGQQGCTSEVNRVMSGKSVRTKRAALIVVKRVTRYIFSSFAPCSLSTRSAARTVAPVSAEWVKATVTVAHIYLSSLSLRTLFNPSIY